MVCLLALFHQRSAGNRHFPPSPSRYVPETGDFNFPFHSTENQSTARQESGANNVHENCMRLSIRFKSGTPS